MCEGGCGTDWLGRNIPCVVEDIPFPIIPTIISLLVLFLIIIILYKMYKPRKSNQVQK